MAHYEHGFQPQQDDPGYNDMTKLGIGIYRSEDGGETWKFMNRNFSRPFYYNHVAISPHDDKLTYHYNQNFQFSTDGGRTLQGLPQHRRRPLLARHLARPAQQEPLLHRQRRRRDADARRRPELGRVQEHQRHPVLHASRVDMRDPYYVYGGLQDAGTSGGPSMTRARGIYLNEWFNVQGGDGYHAQVDPTDWRTVYTGRTRAASARKSAVPTSRLRSASTSARGRT